jgi:autoinducer 2-degrading protein
MYTVFVIVKVKPGAGEAFLEAARRNREGTRRESGNVRFDVLRAAHPSSDPADPELFYLFEAYQSAADFAAHQQTPHYHAFRESVSAIMAEPRFGIHAVPVHSDPWE